MKQHNSLLIALFLLCGAVTACRVGKDFVKPTAALPEKFRNAPAQQDSSSIGSLSWKTFFTDPVLQGLIDSAIVKNYDVQLAMKNVAIAAQTAKVARMGNLPDINLQVSGNRNWPSKNSMNGSLSEQFMGTRYMDDYNLNLGLTWEVIAWGKISRLKEVALAEYLSSGEASKAVQTRVVSEVAQGYYNLLMLDAQLVIARKNLQLNDSTLQLMQWQYNSGQINTLALEQTQAQRQVAAGLVPKLEQQIIQQENALRILTGELPAGVARHAALSESRFKEQLSVGFPASMLTYRPDVHAAELAVKTANARAGIAQAAMYPALNITAGVGLNSFRSYNWLNIPGSLFETVGGSITQPIFQRGKLKADYEKAVIEREKSILEFRKTVLTAVGEVSDALVKVDKLREQEAITRTRVDKLQSATRNAGLLFQSGMATYLEVITAQSNVLQSELDLASLQREQLGAVVELYRSLGGGWK
ncbi:efflux transporter outer membrane subunit [Chitinophaga nivalis]|uniref:Efflux transporter outer membrane subunit n=1 Tax=Chitinophaga nivalis TaxID=2991709 RepID=A0ABT3IGR4_9BACT|nr:efflux transporter outer membrane subunit [Chitinophaga nivalis]MCW3467158.1 efflux transporter outer membrane subunit [Chitinophaga nivalis]MCW3483150.1 efflux transporter outer membrane subunit [Chitinophaga nivalis]